MKKTFLIIFISSLIFTAFSQVLLNYEGGSNYILTERTDLRRYDNGKYKGLVSREVKAYIKPELLDDVWKYEGFFHVNQDTRRAENFVSKGIHDYISSVFTISTEGEYVMLEDCGYPSFRNFPLYPDKEISIGDEWNGYLIRSVDPLEKNKPTKMKSSVLYKYVNDSVFNNEEVYVISAQWATRYNCLSDDADLDGDYDLVSANGRHNAQVYISKKDGRAILIRDTLEETFNYKSCGQVTFKGSIAMFTEYPPSITYEDTSSVAQIISLEENNVDYKVTSTGIQITLYELNFKPDSADLLEEELYKLKLIGEYLKQFKNNKILITGHTARVLDVTGEQELSLERAYTIRKEFEKLGLDSDNFICQGKGGDCPVADNATEEGRAKNRRVEITILADIENK